MQLSKIKMSGFKSFVDPTVVTLPSKLVAIVGPNGCGKSNIIDAVTWVMGESSPKYLRGEALTDVIFNGSSTRKPVGQASVELIFDNSDRSLGGAYAAFNELSVKRVINRDSDSGYYLNGVRCRKRDMMDIFLGTGLGPRSYSIIGQNMINRVIEAKPDELRSYLEEAAGISKYKERRHETELRIQHTKENLARINDLRSELEKQLSNLKHQANVAEKFKLLKEQERTTQAELYAIQWRQLDSRLVDFTLKIQREETAFEARQSELISTDREIEQLHHEQRVAHDVFQEVQRRYYAVGNEITRIEQDVLHHQERQKQWENDLKQTEDEWQNVKNQLNETEDSIRELEHDLEHLEPQFNDAQQEARKYRELLKTAEEALQSWQNRWDEFNLITAKTSQTAQVEKTHIQHLEQRILLLQKRQEQLQLDEGQFNFADLHQEIENITRSSYDMAEQLEYQHKQLNEVRKEITTLQVAQQDSTTHLDNVRNDCQRLYGQQASLEALQETALGQRDNPTAIWLKEHKLNTLSRLGQHIEVENGWEFAVEKVLGFCLQAVCVDQLDEVLTYYNDFKSGDLCIFVKQNQEEGKTETKKPAKKLLLQKIKSPWSLDAILAGIYVAESVNEALGICESLDIHESVITRDGVWVNRSWVKILREEDPAVGVFQREQELKLLTTRIEHLEQTQKELTINIKERHEQLQDLEKKRDNLTQSVSSLQAQAAHVNAQQKMKQEMLAELKLRSERFITEQEDCVTQLKQAQQEIVKAQNLWQQALQELEKQTNTREDLIQNRDKERKYLQSVRDDATKRQTQAHELELRLQTSKAEKTSHHQSITRLQAQLNFLSERRISLQSELNAMVPMETLKKSLSRALDKHVNSETELNSARVAMESLDLEFKNLDEKRQGIEYDLNKTRSILENLRVESQGAKVKADTVLEQIALTDFQLEDLLKQLDPEKTIEEWQTKLDQLIQRIHRLGPINLIAIEEYATCQERKAYLDKQVEDLQEGLSTLEQAIAKIDNETKIRFKETFDKVNQRFQELFPTIFGGGKAYIELTSDDLLESGVTLMACPPGKRNSSIYLLSGGEKALTAIAFIFSIFNLNPSPFCMLDEVDAALDDANIMRFGRLLKVIAEKTQFIFISHNKITIELAEHLIGVTMHEPGVSRLVSVDIEKAISLAGS